MRCWCRRRPSASSASQSRRRGHSRSSASWATSSVSSCAETSRPSTSASSAVAVCSSWSSSSRGMRRRTNAAPCSPASARRSRIDRAARCSGSPSAVYVRSASRPTAPRTPPVRSYAARLSVRPSRSRHCSSSAAESSGSPPGWSSVSAISASVSAGSTVRPARRAGSSIARRSSSRRIGPTSTWLAPTSRASRSSVAQCP